MMNVPNKIIVHHSAVNTSGSQLAAINQYHKEKEFTVSSLGYFVGYHYLIARDGVVTQTREDADEGCHTVGENCDSIGICLEGNMDEVAPTATQENALGKLTVEICERYAIPYTEIYPHRKFANKSCYGSLLKDNWGKIICLTTKIRQLSTMLEELRNASHV